MPYISCWLFKIIYERGAPESTYALDVTIAQLPKISKSSPKSKRPNVKVSSSAESTLAERGVNLSFAKSITLLLYSAAAVIYRLREERLHRARPLGFHGRFVCVQWLESFVQVVYWFSKSRGYCGFCNKRRLTASDCPEGNRRDCSISGN